MFQMTFGEQNTEKEAHEMLSYSFEQGINALDTAEAVSSYFLPIISLNIVAAAAVATASDFISFFLY